MVTFLTPNHTPNAQILCIKANIYIYIYIYRQEKKLRIIKKEKKKKKRYIQALRTIKTFQAFGNFFTASLANGNACMLSTLPDLSVFFSSFCSSFFVSAFFCFFSASPSWLFGVFCNSCAPFCVVQFACFFYRKNK